MTRFPVRTLRLLPAMVLLVACAGPSTPAEESQAPRAGEVSKETRPVLARVPPAGFGEPFPTHVFKDLNPASGTKGTVDLVASAGRRPVVLYYWVPGNTRAERIFEDLQRLVDEIGSSRLALYGVVKQRPGIEAPQILERIQAMKIQVPVLDDEEFRLGQQLMVRSVPSISILDSGGRLRLSNAGSLKQILEYNMDVEAALRRVAQKGTLGTYGPMPHYYPVHELVGKRCPDFEAPTIADGVVRRLSALLDPKRLNVLVFWSVDCPHCKKSLPQINDWLKQHPEGINLITAANIPDDAAKTKTEEYCRLSHFVFPTLVDRGQQIGELYQVTSTPTILIIRPDGVIDSVLLSGEGDFARVFEDKRKELLALSSRS